MTRVSNAIVCQNIEKRQFVAAFPGEIVIGFVKKVLDVGHDDYMFENYATFSRSNLPILGNYLAAIGKVLAGKKKVPETEECEFSECILYRNKTFLIVKNKLDGSTSTFDLSQPNIFQHFCDAIYAVIFATLLPSNEQYNACYTTNLFFRETFPNLSLPDTALESAQKKLEFSAPMYHYLRRNYIFLEFAYKISTLANTK